MSYPQRSTFDLAVLACPAQPGLPVRIDGPAWFRVPATWRLLLSGQGTVRLMLADAAGVPFRGTVCDLDVSGCDITVNTAADGLYLTRIGDGSGDVNAGETLAASVVVVGGGDVSAWIVG